MALLEQTLTEDHPATMASRYALAMVYQPDGQVEEAVSLLEVMVNICEAETGQSNLICRLGFGREIGALSKMSMHVGSAA